MSETAAPDTPTAAGMYDYYLGGTANTPVDRAAAERIKELIPEAVDGAWANRGFLQRAVKRMACEWGIRQFIDIGAGLPTQRSTHEVVAEQRPDGRVVYVDNDPLVIARGREILAGVAGTSVIAADFRQPDEILDHPETRRLIDFREPVGLLLVAIVHFLPDEADPWGLVRRYVAAVPSGSYMALSSGTADKHAPHRVDAIRKIYAATPTPPTMRTRDEALRFFDGLEIVPPYEGAGPELCFLGEWGAEDPQAADSDGSRWGYAAVARRP